MIANPYLMEGEVVSVQTKKAGLHNRTYYTCEVTMANGSKTFLPNCSQSSLFGGIGDYTRGILNARENSEYVTGIERLQPNNLEASVGDRVYILCVNGSNRNPIIIGCAQHPNQTEEGTEPTEDDKGAPVWLFQKTGLRQSIDKDGQFRIIHKGPQSVSFLPKDNSAIGAAFDAVSGLAGASEIGEGNPALEASSESEFSALEMLNGGIIKLRDSAGSNINFDPSSETLTISNNKTESFTDIPPNPSLLGAAFGAAADLLSGNVGGINLSESIVLDNSASSLSIGARDLLAISVNSDREDLVGGDFTSKIVGASSVSIVGDSELVVGGSLTETFAVDRSAKIGGDLSFESVGAVSILAASDLSIVNAIGTGIEISANSIKIGGQTAELLTLFDEVIDEILTSLQDTVVPANQALGNLGFPTVVNPAYVTAVTANITKLTAIKVKLATIKG